MAAAFGLAGVPNAAHDLVSISSPQSFTAVKLPYLPCDRRKAIKPHRNFGYRLEARQLGVATLLLALMFRIVCGSLGDSLSIGYAMAVPVYLYLSTVIEHARIEKSSFREFRGWAETAVAAAGAVGTAYLGYRLWLLGY